jgi:hypothetical protein
MQDYLIVSNDNGMAGIRAALETDHDIGKFCEYVNNLAFSFVAPLDANDDNIRHTYYLSFDIPYT